MNDSKQNPENNPMSEIDSAIWSIISEPIDADAVARVKENAKRLGNVEIDVEHLSVERRPDSSNPTQSSVRYRSFLVQLSAIAAVVLIVVAILFNPGSQKSAFAAAIEKLKIIKAFSFDRFVYSENLVDPAKSRVLVSVDGRQRTEVGNVITISDKTGIPRLTLMSNSKTALVHEPVKGLKEFDQLMWFEKLKNFAGEDTTHLGEKVTDGVNVSGTEVEIGNDRFRVWVKTDSREIFEVEAFYADSAVFRSVSKNFDFVLEVDDSLFSYEPPAEYTVGEFDPLIVEATYSPEKNIIDALKGYASIAEGNFPDSLDNWSDWLPVLSKSEKPDLQLASRLGAMLPFLNSLKPADRGYRGKGLKLNQRPTEVVFWYKTKSGVHRAIDTNLESHDLDEKDIPTTVSDN